VGLEETNVQLKASEVEMRNNGDKSGEVVALLSCQLEEELENYDLMKCGNDSLLVEGNTFRDRVANLESELAETKTSVAGDVPALEAKVASIEARFMDDAAAVDKHFVDFREELTGDLAGLREAYERNIQSLGGICSPPSDDTPSVEDYLH
jgi:hypothetical protein